MPLSDTLQEQGYAVMQAVFSADAVADMRKHLQHSLGSSETGVRQSRGQVFAVRNLHLVCPPCLEWSRHPRIASVVETVLGPRAGLVRAILFDKPPLRSWALPWHQDKMIPVAEFAAHSSFLHPTRKAGQLHCEAPVAILERMLTVRLHLDDVRQDNGALEVSPGSHRYGKTPPPPEPSVLLPAQSGDVLLMRPLLLHRSARSTPGCTRSRRVVQLEYGAEPLPSGLSWSLFHPVAELPHSVGAPVRARAW